MRSPARPRSRLSEIAGGVLIACIVGLLLLTLWVLLGEATHRDDDPKPDVKEEEDDDHTDTD